MITIVQNELHAAFMGPFFHCYSTKKRRSQKKAHIAFYIAINTVKYHWVDENDFPDAKYLKSSKRLADSSWFIHLGRTVQRGKIIIIGTTSGA